MVAGNDIGLFVVELVVKAPTVSASTATQALLSYQSEIRSLVASLNLSVAHQTVESSSFKLVVNAPLTFDAIFGSIVRRSTVLTNRTITTKDQMGRITSVDVKVDANCSFFVSVFGQIFRAEYLRRLYNLIESSSQKTTLLQEANAKLEDLYATAKILGPVPDELYGVVDGGIYLYRDTIAQNSQFYVTSVYSALPPQLKQDFEFMQASSLTGLYSLPGYEPGMNSGIESALTTRGALSKLNDNARWLHVTETLDAVVTAPQAIVDLLAFDAPRIIAFITLARKVSMMNQEISLSALDANTLKLFATLRKISNKSDLVVLSTNELIHDIIELAPALTSDIAVQEDFIKLFCKLCGVTKTVISYAAGATEAQKRLIRLAGGQWESDYSSITGLTPSVSENVVIFSDGVKEVGRITFEGPYGSSIALIEKKRSSALQDVISILSSTSALIDTASLGKVFSISPSTRQMSFSYTIDQLKAAVAEVLVDFTRSLYKRSQ